MILPTSCSRSARSTSRSSCTRSSCARALSQVRRLTDPMRTVMTDLVDAPPPAVKGKASPQQRGQPALDAARRAAPPRRERRRRTARGPVVGVRHQPSRWPTCG